MRDREQPLDQGIPPIEVSFYVGVVDLQGGQTALRRRTGIGL